MTSPRHHRLVLSYLGESHYHRLDTLNDQRPACDPRRIRGVPSIRVSAERKGLTPCPDCWPDEADR